MIQGNWLTWVPGENDVYMCPKCFILLCVINVLSFLECLLASPLVRRQQQLERNMEELTRTVSDHITDLENRVSCITKGDNSHKV